jgi:ATP-binding cassette, subfamily B, bacterial
VKTTLLNYIYTTIKPYKLLVSLLIFPRIMWAINKTLLPYILKLIIDKAISYDENEYTVFNAIGPYIALYLLSWLMSSSNMRVLDLTKLKLYPNIRQDIISTNFAYLNQHSYKYFQNNFAGSLINKIADLQSGVVDIISTFDAIYAAFLCITVASITLLIVQPIFAFILLIWIAIYIAITFFYLSKIQRLSRIHAETRTSLVGKMVDSISNIINIRLFAKHKHENKHVNSSIADTVKKDRNMQAKIIEMRVFWDISIIILLSADLIILSKMYGDDLVTIGDFTFIITLSVSMFYTLWTFSDQCAGMSEQLGKCNQALSILNAAHDITDDINAHPLKVTDGKIEFKNVCFNFQKKSKLFENKSVTIKPGEKVGLVGFSGSGKSTFVNLILRLFEVESGEIFIDGQNVDLVTQESLRENIALIPQDISLFHRSLFDNIRYGKTTATYEEVIVASKKAHCHEFIKQLDKGYESLVGERGIKLSGGQRQRIAIARAILKNSPILILDEATSSLDSLTEKFIQSSLHYLMKDKTTIVIAHRLSTLSEMDRILVFDNGKIIEDGTHQQLLRLEKHYFKLWQMQAGGFLPE